MSTKKLPSRITVEGLDRTPHRAFLRGLGLSDADLGKPFVGVASTDGRVTPRTAAELYRLHAAQGKGDKEISTIVELLAGK